MLDASRKVVICHGTDTGVGPYILGCFHHVYYRINGQNDTQNGNGSAYARHQRECEEITTHGHTGITYSREDGDEHPQEDGCPRDGCAAILHHKERGDQDEGCTAVHVNRSTDGQHKTGNVLANAQTVFGCLHGNGQGGCAALGEQGHQHGRHHAAQHMDRILASCQQEQRQYNEELNNITTQDHQHILANRTGHDSARHLGRQLGREGDDAEGQGPDEPANQQEEQLLKSKPATTSVGRLEGAMTT